MFMLNKRLISILATAATLKKKRKKEAKTKTFHDPNTQHGPEEHTCHVYENISR